jgi:hypothetical protein
MKGAGYYIAPLLIFAAIYIAMRADASRQHGGPVALALIVSALLATLIAKRGLSSDWRETRVALLGYAAGAAFCGMLAFIASI